MDVSSLTLDQLRLFVSVVDAGGFAAAGRALHRSQSVVSYGVANLEENLGVALFDRSVKRKIELTPAGRALLGRARDVLTHAQSFAQLAQATAQGQESELSLVVDMMFPTHALIQLCTQAHEVFPEVSLRVYTEAMGDVLQRVRACEGPVLGVQGPDGLEQDVHMSPLSTIELECVVAAGHPLADHEGSIPSEVLRQHNQIVLTTDDAQAHRSVLNPPRALWHTADLHTKRAMIRAGLGWGNLPTHMIAQDLEEGRLRALTPAVWEHVRWSLPLYTIWPKAAHQGPVLGWVAQTLSEVCATPEPR